MKVSIRPAVKETDHKLILDIAKQSKFTKDFGSIMFSSDESYNKGWIRVATLGDEIIGFTCVRHCMPKRGETVLYFITVHDKFRSHSIGGVMMKDLEEQTPHKRIALNVAKDNPRAVSFYERLGFTTQHGDAIKGTAFHMTKEL